MVALLKNRYRILSSLSKGGFGETFLAEDTDIPSARRCVLKKLIPIADDPQIYQLVKDRFQREAAILERLGDSDPQIPTLYAYFEEAGQFYLVQEWIDGITLTEKIQQDGVLTESTVREILISILSVLDCVHRERIIHRDIKPDNIILRHRDGKPVLIDFGAVKETMGTVMSPSGRNTNSIIIGTPGFMPSEQNIGRPVYASDLYSLGLTAIYLLTGKPPYELATNPATGEILWQQEALGVSPALADILNKAIQFNPRDRYSSAQEMSDAIPRFPNIITAPGPTKVIQDLSPTKKGISDWQKAAITGSIIGSFIMGALLVNNHLNHTTDSQNTDPKSTSQVTVDPNNNNTDSESGTQVTSKPNKSLTNSDYNPQATIQPNDNTTVAPLPSQTSAIKDLYFVADSAFPDAYAAEQQINDLKVMGYEGAGKIWVQDYVNLSNKALFQVYPAKFSDRSSCATFLNAYSKVNPQAYCFRASHSKNISVDRFYAK